MSLAATGFVPAQTLCTWRADGIFACRTNETFVDATDDGVPCSAAWNIAPCEAPRILLKNFWTAVQAAPGAFQNTLCPGSVRIVPGMNYSRSTCKSTTTCGQFVRAVYRVLIDRQAYRLRFAARRVPGATTTFQPKYCLVPLAPNSTIPPLSAQLQKIQSAYAAIPRSEALPAQLPVADIPITIKIVPESAPPMPAGADRYPASFMTKTVTLHKAEGKYVQLAYGDRLERYGNDPARRQRVLNALIKYLDSAVELLCKMKPVKFQRSKVLIMLPQTYTEKNFGVTRYCSPCFVNDPSAAAASDRSGPYLGPYVIIGRSDFDNIEKDVSATNNLFHELTHAVLGSAMGEPIAQWFAGVACKKWNATIAKDGVMRAGNMQFNYFKLNILLCR